MENPAVEEQCNDRVHRIGQTKPVTVHVAMVVHPNYQHNSFDCLLHSLMTRKRRLPSAAPQEDADRLREMLAAGEADAAGDPVSVAIARMFERDEVSVPPRNSDGSLSFH